MAAAVPTALCDWEVGLPWLRYLTDEAAKVIYRVGAISAFTAAHTVYPTAKS